MVPIRLSIPLGTFSPFASAAAALPTGASYPCDVLVVGTFSTGSSDGNNAEGSYQLSDGTNTSGEIFRNVTKDSKGIGSAVWVFGTVNADTTYHLEHRAVAGVGISSIGSIVAIPLVGKHRIKIWRGHVPEFQRRRQPQMPIRRFPAVTSRSIRSRKDIPSAPFMWPHLSRPIKLQGVQR